MLFRSLRVCFPVTITTLIIQQHTFLRFWRNPVKNWLQQTLNWQAPYSDEAWDAAEPFTPVRDSDTAAAYLEARRHNENFNTTAERLHAQSMLPTGELGRLWRENYETAAKSLDDTLLKSPRNHPHHPTTRRTDLGDDFHTDMNGNKLTFEDWSVNKNNSVYGRRSDWKTIFAIAKKYLQNCVDNPGSVVLHLTDSRSTGSNGQVFGNPYQYTFQQMHSGASETLADESLFEIPQQYNYSSARPAYIGRPSSGGNGGAPCIGCGQDRIQAHFYYGWFDNNASLS